jgi:hypothetical protein
MSARHRTRSEREQLELFRALPGDLAPRDAQDLMAYPKRNRPRLRPDRKLLPTCPAFKYERTLYRALQAKYPDFASVQQSTSQWRPSRFR